jgi:hypothetical protein
VELDLAVRDGHQPRPEPVRLAQAGNPADRLQHGVLHQIVDVRVTVEGAADDVVDEREMGGDEFVDRVLVAGPGRADELGDVPFDGLTLSHHLALLAGRLRGGCARARQAGANRQSSLRGRL